MAGTPPSTAFMAAARAVAAAAGGAGAGRGADTQDSPSSPLRPRKSDVFDSEGFQAVPFINQIYPDGAFSPGRIQDRAEAALEQKNDARAHAPRADAAADAAERALLLARSLNPTVSLSTTTNIPPPPPTQHRPPWDTGTSIRHPRHSKSLPSTRRPSAWPAAAAR